METLKIVLALVLVVAMVGVVWFNYWNWRETSAWARSAEAYAAECRANLERLRRLAAEEQIAEGGQGEEWSASRGSTIKPEAQP